MAWAAVWDFLFWNWGDLAIVLGLAVSVATVLVASKAREKNEKVGLFLSQRKWDIVWLPEF